MEYPVRWTCEVVVLRFQAYLLGTLVRGDALAVAEHLEACILCAQELALAAENPVQSGDAGE